MPTKNEQINTIVESLQEAITEESSQQVVEQNQTEMLRREYGQLLINDGPLKNPQLKRLNELVDALAIPPDVLQSDQATAERLNVLKLALSFKQECIENAQRCRLDYDFVRIDNRRREREARWRRGCASASEDYVRRWQAEYDVLRESKPWLFPAEIDMEQSEMESTEPVVQDVGESEKIEQPNTPSSARRKRQ